MSRAAPRRTASHARRTPAAHSLPSTPTLTLTITACLIVKNEEYHLPRCLASLRRTVDEIVLVDTGSTDSTIEIARAAGARIFHFPWCNDFGAARNESLRHATGDWAVWVDADEELVELQPGILHELCRQVPADCVGLWTRCQNLSNEQGEIGSIAQQWRIFRNHRQAHFEGAIHEQLRLPAGQEVRLVPQEQAFIRHWGYIPRPGVLEQKAERNRTLIEATVEADPSEPFNHYCLGKQLAGENRFAEALPHLENAIRLWQERGQPNYAFLSNLFTAAMISALNTGDLPRVLSLEQLIPPAFVTADTLFQVGVALWKTGQAEQAIQRFERASGDTSVQAGFETDPSYSTWRPLNALAELHAELGNIGAAYEYAERAAGYPPDRPNVLYALAYLSAARQDYQNCVRWSRRLLAAQPDNVYKPQARRLLLNMGSATTDADLVLEATTGDVLGVPEPERLLLRANAHLAAGNPHDGRETLGAAVRKFPTDFPLRLALTEVLDAAGDHQNALRVLAEGLDQPNPPAKLYIRLARMLAAQGRLDDAANALSLASRGLPAMSDGVGQPRETCRVQPDGW